MPIRENPTLMREVIEKMGYMVRVMDGDHRVVYMNEKMRETYGDTMGRMCYELLGLKNKCGHCVATESRESGKVDMKDILIGERYYKVISSPANIENGEAYSIELLHDITEEKEIENKLMKHYEKLQSDIKFAQHVQQRVLPQDGTYGDALIVNSRYAPSEDLGGDLYDVMEMSDDKMLLYMADVSGHGVTSSLLTIFLRQMVRSKVEDLKIDLKTILGQLLKSYNELGIEKEHYLTILFCEFDKEKHEAKFMNAGHNCLPLIIKNNGEVEKVEVNGMPVCNLTKKPVHEQITVKVEEGESIVMYTDGLIEACNDKKEAFGHERVKEIIKQNLSMDGKDLVKKIFDEVKAFTKKAPEDDMALLIAKVTE